MTLKQYALWIAGPRDLLINLAINGGCFWTALREHSQVPLLQNPSLMLMMIPMFVLLPSLVTFFGYLNGYKHRRKLECEAGIFTGIPWLKPAIIEGLAAGAISMVIWTIGFGLLSWFAPTSRLPGKPTAMVIAILAGLFAYVLQVRAVIRVQRL